MKLVYLLCLTFLTIFTGITATAQPSSTCKEWFNDAKIKRNTKNCIKKCSILLTDMASFPCPHQCDLLCKNEVSTSIQNLIFYPGLTPKEKELISKFPKEALLVFVQKTIAEQSAARNFPDQGLNDESDAFRHFTWAGLLTKELGTDVANQFLDAHEENRLQASSEKEMDTFNNKVGQEAAKSLIKNKSWSLKNLEAEGLKFLRTKKLMVIKPGLRIPENPQ